MLPIDKCDKVETFIQAAIFDNQHDFGNWVQQGRTSAKSVREAIKKTFGQVAVTKDITLINANAEESLLQKLGLEKYPPGNERRGIWHIPENPHSYASTYYKSILQSPSIDKPTLDVLGESIGITGNTPLYLTIDTLGSKTLQDHIRNYSQRQRDKKLTDPNILVVNCPQTHFDPATKVTAYTPCGIEMGIDAEETLSYTTTRGCKKSKCGIGTFNATGTFVFPPLNEILVRNKPPVPSIATAATAATATTAATAAPATVCAELKLPTKGGQYVCREEMLKEGKSNALFVSNYEISAFMHRKEPSGQNDPKVWEAYVFIKNPRTGSVVIADKSFASKRMAGGVDNGLIERLRKKKSFHLVGLPHR